MVSCSGCLIIIPAYNEAFSIEGVIESVFAYNHSILVVDDHSTDTTASLVRSTNKCSLITNSSNLGYERSLYVGIKYALSHGFSSCISIDADGEHDPATIPSLLSGLQKSDICIASRSRYNRLVEHFLSFFFSIFFGFSDPLSGFKAYNLSTVSFDPLSFTGVGTNILFKSYFHRLKIINCPSYSPKRVGSSRYGASFATNFSILVRVCFAFIRALLSLPNS